MEPEQIKAIREALKMTQARFAAVIGVTRFHVMRMESGQSKPGKTLQILLSRIKP